MLPAGNNHNWLKQELSMDAKTGGWKFEWQRLLGANPTRVSRVSPCLASRDTDGLCSGVASKDVCIWTAFVAETVFSSWAKGRLSNVREDKDNDSLAGKCQAGLLPLYKIQVSHNMPPFVQGSPGPVRITPWEPSWGTRRILTFWLHGYYYE